MATAVSLVIGVAWGATAGYLGGVVDEVMMRIVDVLYSLPFIFFVIILMVTFGSNFILLFVAIGAVRVADHGADRARPDAVAEAEGVHRGGARRRA